MKDDIVIILINKIQNILNAKEVEIKN